MVSVQPRILASRHGSPLQSAMLEKDQKVALLAIAVNITLFTLKYVFAEFSGSMALKAGAFDSLSDVVASFTVLAGLVIARRKTRSFPYGLYKIENLVAVVIALVILYVGYGIAREAIAGRTLQLQNVGPAAASIVAVIAITFAFSRYEARVGKAINSPSLIADARHIRTDMLANSVVLMGLGSNFVGLDLDRIAAFIIVIFIAITGGKILVDGIRVLLDASLDYPTLSLAEKLIQAEPRVVEIQGLRGRNSGRYKFLEADIVLKTQSLEKAKFISDRISQKIRRQIKHVDRVRIHYEPSKKAHLTYALPLTDSEGRQISDHFGQAPYFLLATVRAADRKVSEREILTNPFTQATQGKGIRAAEFLGQHAIDAIITKEGFEGKGPFYVFSNAGVDTLVTQRQTVAEALAELGIGFPAGEPEALA